MSCVTLGTSFPRHQVPRRVDHQSQPTRGSYAATHGRRSPLETAAPIQESAARYHRTGAGGVGSRTFSAELGDEERRRGSPARRHVVESSRSHAVPWRAVSGSLWRTAVAICSATAHGELTWSSTPDSQRLGDPRPTPRLKRSSDTKRGHGWRIECLITPGAWSPASCDQQEHVQELAKRAAETTGLPEPCFDVLLSASGWHHRVGDGIAIPHASSRVAPAARPVRALDTRWIRRRR